ncbi:permease-like cell division protein FtsX [Spirillospora sp. NPDC052242]
MNRTEERLKDALDAVGETLRPGDVPPPRFAERRRTRTFRRIVPMVAAAAVVAVAAGGAALAGGVLDGTDGAAASPAASPSPSTVRAPTSVHVSVYLCTRTSSNEACRGRDATPREAQMIGKRLEAMSIVEHVDFESRMEAYERWRKRFASETEFEMSVRAGDLPEMYRVWVRGAGNDAAVRKGAVAVRRAVTGLPGVDQVVIEGKG